MIVSASRRTDLPAFYSEWLMERLRAGFVDVRNPRNPAQTRRVSLLAEDVDCFVFWTKDPAPMLPLLPELDRMGHRYYFQFTLTPYGKTLEPGLRDKAALLETFRELAAHVGRERVVWRYDPIVLNGVYDLAFHRERFAAYAARLAGCTEQATISFVDRYAKLARAYQRGLLREILPEEQAELCGSFAATAAREGLRLAACCEAGLEPYGVAQAHCIDRELAERLCGGPVSAAPDKNQRPGCGCAASVDIGSYGKCGHGCIYCYANR